MENFTLGRHESRTVLKKSAFASSDSVLVNVKDGPRAVVSLDIESIDGGASVEVLIEDAFDTNAGFEEVATFSRNTAGRTDQVISDYHSQLKITATVTGGNATFHIGITVFELGAGPESSLPPGAATEDTLQEVRDRLVDISGYVDGLEGLTQQVIDASEAIGGYVDGLEGFTDGLEPLLTAISGYVDGLEGYVDGLEALIAAGNASLASIDSKMSSDTGTPTSVTASAVDATILAANSSRKGFSLYNDSNRTCYVLFASGTSSATNFSVVMGPGDYYENQNPAVYRGVIKGIWTFAAGAMRVTEYT
jgi:hypothetical protein